MPDCNNLQSVAEIFVSHSVVVDKLLYPGVQVFGFGVDEYFFKITENFFWGVAIIFTILLNALIPASLTFFSLMNGLLDFVDRLTDVGELVPCGKLLYHMEGLLQGW